MSLIVTVSKYQDKGHRFWVTHLWVLSQACQQHWMLGFVCMLQPCMDAFIMYSSMPCSLVPVYQPFGGSIVFVWQKSYPQTANMCILVGATPVLV